MNRYDNRALLTGRVRTAIVHSPHLFKNGCEQAVLFHVGRINPSLIPFSWHRLLRQSGATIGSMTLGIAAEICVAAGSNDVLSLKAWYLAGVDFNRVRNASGRTPLHEAVCSLCKEAVEYLLSRGINPATEDNLGFSALQNGIQLEKTLCVNNTEKHFIICDILNSLNNCEVFRDSLEKTKV